MPIVQCSNEHPAAIGFARWKEVKSGRLVCDHCKREIQAAQKHLYWHQQTQFVEIGTNAS